MKLFKLLCTTFTLILLVLSSTVQADIREIYVCNFLKGKNIDDVMSARDYYLKQAKKAGIATPDAFVWTPYKSSLDYDVLWFNNYKDLMEFGTQADAFNSSSAMTSVIERFNSVMSCKSSLASRETIFAGGDSPVANPPAIISSNACMMKAGVQPDNMNDLKAHIKGVLGSIPGYKNSLLFMSTPMTPGSNSPDVFLYGVHDNVSAWAAKRAAFLKSDGGAMLGRHFQSTLDCTASLWVGQQVVPKS
mgnify:CR=1 FL=1